MSFTATRDIPNEPDNPSDDQPIMKTNNNSFIGIWDVDHVGFGQNNGGTHNVVRLNALGTNPTLNATQGAFFSKIVAGNTEAFYRYGSAPQNTFQLTNNGAVAAAQGVTSIISPEATPMKMQWCARTLDNNGQTIRDNSPFLFTTPFTNVCYSVVITGQKGSNGPEGFWVADGTLTKNGFSLRTNAAAGQFTAIYYIAIGN